jgi:hypothetical protein
MDNSYNLEAFHNCPQALGLRTSRASQYHRKRIMRTRVHTTGGRDLFAEKSNVYAEISIKIAEYTPTPHVCDRRSFRYIYQYRVISIYSRDWRMEQNAFSSHPADIYYSVTELPLHSGTPQGHRRIAFTTLLVPSRGHILFSDGAAITFRHTTGTQAHRIRHNVVVQSAITHQFLDFSSHPPDIYYSVTELPLHSGTDEQALHTISGREE